MLCTYTQGPEGDRIIEMALQNPEKYVLKNQVEAEGNVISYTHNDVKGIKRVAIATPTTHLICLHDIINSSSLEGMKL